MSSHPEVKISQQDRPEGISTSDVSPIGAYVNMGGFDPSFSDIEFAIERDMMTKKVPQD